mgnify:CR=1 FL=1
MRLPIFNLLKLKSLSLYFVSSIITAGIGIFINPFLSIGLSHKDFAIIGYYAAFSSLFVPFLSLALSNYYARKYYQIEKEKREKIYQTILSIYLILGALTLMILIVAYFFYHKNYVKSIEFFPYAILSFLPLYFINFYNLYLLDLRMKNKAKQYSIISIANAVLGAALSLLMVYFFHYGAIGRLLALLVTSVLFSVFAFNIKKFKFLIDKDIAKEAFLFSWPLIISAVLSFFFMGIDRTFLEKINDNYNLGLYNVGLQISGYLSIFGTVLFQTFQPDIYKYTSKNEHKKLLKLALFVLVLNAVPIVLFIMLSEPLISVLTYGKYIESVDFAKILSVKLIATTFAFLMSEILVGYGFSKMELLNRILGAIFSVVIYLFFIKYWGFYGAAWGQSVTWIVMGIISLLSLFFVKFRKTSNTTNNS